MQISRLWNAFLSWIDTRVDADPDADFEHTVKCRFLVILALQFAGILLLRLLHVWVILPEITTAKMVTLAMALLILSLPWILFRTRSVSLAGGLLLGVMYLSVLVTAMLTGGIGSAAIPFLVLFPLAAGFLFGLWGGGVAVAVCFVSLIGFSFLEGTALIQPHGLSDEVHRTSLITSVGLATFITFVIVMNYGLVARNTFERLRKARDQADAANQAKSDFLANMSHELRTPMNGVLGMLELLLQGEMSKDQRHFAMTARESGQSLLVLLNDILDFSRLEAGRIDLDYVSFNVGQVIDNVRSLIAAKAVTKGLKLMVDVDPDLPAWLEGDPTRIRQVLFNLVDNAIKFTDAGSVTIEARLVSRSDERVSMTLAVRDTGIGIPEAHIDRLFERFEQVDSSSTRRFGGAGLGLAITRQLVTIMDGTISVESRVGRGSTFTVTFDLAIGAPVIPEIRKRTKVEHMPDSLRVLLVEDHNINQMMMHTMLTKIGHLVDIAANGQEALDQIAANEYDLVLMDIQMPVMDGIAATTAIREMPEPACNTPIVALTANVMPEQRLSYFEAGMDEFVGKPVDPEKLARAIANAIAKRKGSEPLSAAG